MLQPHTLKPAHGAKHAVKRIGRGNASGHGTYSTRGGKGQTARSGGSRGLWQKAFKAHLQQAPKLRGFKSPNQKTAEVYLSDLSRVFNDGDTVDIKSLQEKKLLTVNDRTAKIVSTGELAKKLIIAGVACTAGAAEKIKAAGGEIR